MAQRKSIKNKKFGFDKMAQWVKSLATKPEFEP